MRKLKLLAGLVFVLSVAESATASTIIPGGSITGSETWTPAGSPYIVQGDLTVTTAGSLTIQAGTVVQFAATDSQAAGIDPFHIELSVAGSLAINGTAANPVVLQPQNAVDYGDWYGIVVYPAAASVVVNFATVTNATRALQSSATGNLLRISNSTFQHSNVGINILAGSPVLDALTVEDCYEGIAVTNDAGGVISNSVLRNNINYGLYYNPTLGSPALLLTQATVYGGSSGIEVENAIDSATLTIQNSIVANSQIGVNVEFPGGVSTTFSNVYGNRTDYYGTTAGTGSISADPLFISPPADLRLQPESPSINSGSAMNASNHDHAGLARPNGAGYDMGAYESTDVLLRNGFEKS